ncbi:MAG TPA: ATP-binding protein, partial [Polyangiaceae bacterium]|nr:ATP-binding protein [Polyangiaceae bacterium]
QREELGELATDMNLMSEELARARRTSEQAIQDKLSALEQLRHAERLATVGRLAAGVAHELGTPLHVVLGHTKMLESGEVSTPVDIIDSLQTIRRQSERMTTIIRQLLDFSRSRKPNKTRVDLVRIAREAANMLSAMASKHGIRLEVLGNSEGLFASVDESQVLQVLTNLLKNSVDATTSQAPVTVRVSAAERDASKPDEKMLRIDVIDHGSGISAEVREHLFEPFFTTKDVGAGSGLGLAVSHGIIQEHGGEIRVESAPDGGSVFTVLLPAEGACLPA